MRTVFEIMIEGGARAAALVPLLFAVHVAPAHAQLPRAVAASATVPAVPAAPTLIEPTRMAGPLALKSRHMDIRIEGRSARVRTQLVYRNDTSAAVKANYLLAAGARLVSADESEGCGGDLGAADAAYVESGEAPPRLQSVEVEVAPGEDITIETHRDADLFVRGARHRLVLPVGGDDRAVFTPEFSAIVEVVGAQPIATLSSATHGGFITGIGERVAQLEITNGRAYRSQFLALEFELGEPQPEFVAVNLEPMFHINARTRR
jgi:hypothetical protein